MIVKKTFKFRLKPRKNQRGLFAQFAGASRWLYNRGLSQQKERYEQNKKKLSCYDLNNQLPGLKEEYPWLKDVHSQVLQQTMRDLDLAYQHFFRRVKLREKPGFPRYKCKGVKDSFRYPQGVKVKDNRVFLPKIGLVRFVQSRDIEGEVKQSTVIRDGGKWYICFSCEYEREIEDVKLSAERAVGIDMGLLSYATLAIGVSNSEEKIANPRFFKRNYERLKHLSRQLSRKVKKSKNWIKAKNRLQRFHAYVRNCRNDFAHKLSHEIVKSHDLICVESLSVSKLLEDSSTRLSRSLADAGWRNFLHYLKYKCLEKGKHFLEAEKFFPSTQQCSCCESRNSLKLSERKLHCSCGLVIDRDLNAAINVKNICLKAAGISVLKLVELPR